MSSINSSFETFSTILTGITGALDILTFGYRDSKQQKAKTCVHVIKIAFHSLRGAYSGVYGCTGMVAVCYFSHASENKKKSVSENLERIICH